MLVKVISLKNSPRRKICNSRLDNIDFSYFNAVDISCDDKKHHFDLQTSLRIYGRTFTNGEIGCSISHKLIIDDFAKNHLNNNWLVIFEDDVQPERSLPNFLNRLESVTINDPVIMLLGHSHTRKSTLKVQRLKQPLSEITYINGVKFGINNFINYCGTVGYAINISATKLISKQQKIFWLADDWQKIRNLGIKIIHPITPLLYEDFRLNSSIGNTQYDFHDIKIHPLNQIAKIFLAQYLRIMNIRDPEHFGLKLRL